MKYFFQKFTESSTSLILTHKHCSDTVFTIFVKVLWLYFGNITNLFLVTLRVYSRVSKLGCLFKTEALKTPSYIWNLDSYAQIRYNRWKHDGVHFWCRNQKHAQRSSLQTSALLALCLLMVWAWQQRCRARVTEKSGKRLYSEGFAEG